jgi:hypothetical protein
VAECTVPAGTPVSITANVSDPNGDPLTVTWNADGSQVEVDNVSGSAPPTSAAVTLNHAFQLGIHNLNVQVTDGRSNPVACQSTITIRDTTPSPVTAAVGLGQLWSPNHDLIDVGFTATAPDSCAGPLPVAVKVFSDESQSQKGGDATFSPDSIGGVGTLQLRSERSGKGNGRVYLIVAQATDPSHNTGTACTTVVVPHDNTPESIQAVLNEAAAAQAFCTSHAGSAPNGYFAIGSGPATGPKP